MNFAGGGAHGFTVEGDTSRAQDSLTSTGCGDGWHAAGDLTWAFRADAPARATFTLEGDYNTLLHLREGGCGDDDEIGCDDSFIARSTLRADLEAGRVYHLVVDGFADEAGRFTLSAQLDNLGERFRTRYLRLPPGRHLLGVDGRSAGEAGAYALSYRTYPLACEPGETVCDEAGTLHTCAIDGAREQSLEACFLGCDPGAGECLVDAHDTCEGAAALEDDAGGDTQRSADRWDGGGAECGAHGRDLWYGLELEACSDVSVRVTPAADLDVSAFFVEGCPGAGGPVLTCRDAGGAGVRERVTVRAGPGPLRLVVDSPAPGAGGPFALEVSVDPTDGCPPPPLSCPDDDGSGPNGSRAEAAEIRPGEIHGIVCGGAGAADWYVARGLSAGNELTVTLTSDTPLTPALWSPDVGSTGVVVHEGGAQVLRHSVGRFEDGTWHLSVTDEAGAVSPAAYTLRLEAAAGDPPAVACRDEDRWWPNGEAAHAAAIEAAVTRGVACHADSEEEWFVLRDLPAGHRVRAELTFDDDDANLDLSARVDDAPADDSVGVGDREFVEATVGAAGGDVHLVIHNRSAGSAAAWALDVSVLRP